MERLSISRSVAEKSDVKGYNKLLAKMQRQYKVVGVNDNTLRRLQDRLEYTVSVHRATLAPTQDSTATD